MFLDLVSSSPFLHDTVLHVQALTGVSSSVPVDAHACQLQPFGEEWAVYLRLICNRVKEAISRFPFLGCSSYLSASGISRRIVQLKQQKKAVKSEVRRRATDVKKGAWGGSMEAEAYARQNNKQVVIHQVMGRPQSMGLTQPMETFTCTTMLKTSTLQ